MSKEYKAPSAVADINVTPMVDIMLVLLIIFMVITPMLQKTFSVDMVKTENPRKMPDADKDDAVVLAVSRDGSVFLGTSPIKLDEITQKTKDMISSRLDKTVYVKSDARAKYGDVVKVINNVRAAGVDSLGLLTEKLQKAGASPPVATDVGGGT
jgi:biopolymer transport protein ExbD